MGISGSQFWATSKNGKAMIVMLARRGDIELVRDICEWMIVQRRKTLHDLAVKRGANATQADIVARDSVAQLEAMATRISDRAAEGVAIGIVDAVFHDYHVNGTWAMGMAWLSDQLRIKVKDV